MAPGVHLPECSAAVPCRSGRQPPRPLRRRRLRPRASGTSPKPRRPPPLCVASRRVAAAHRRPRGPRRVAARPSLSPVSAEPGWSWPERGGLSRRRFRGAVPRLVPRLGTAPARWLAVPLARLVWHRASPCGGSLASTAAYRLRGADACSGAAFGACGPSRLLAKIVGGCDALSSAGSRVAERGGGVKLRIRCLAHVGVVYNHGQMPRRALERCQSGRMGLTRNQVCPRGHPGFESLPLRQFTGAACAAFESRTCGRS